MYFLKYITIFCILSTLTPVDAYATDEFPAKLLQNVECLKSHGLVQGTVTDVKRGEAHFAPYFRETSIGARMPSIYYNKDLVEGRLGVSPDIIKTCNPAAILRKMD